MNISLDSVTAKSGWQQSQGSSSFQIISIKIGIEELRESGKKDL